MEIILSIQEKYFNLISAGLKKYEYRFVFPKVKEKTRLYLYVSRTKKALLGYIEVSSSQWMDTQTAIKFYSQQNPDEQNSEAWMWEWMGEHQGCHVLKIDSFFQFQKPLTLEYLKEKYQFLVPQNFIYLKDQKLIQEIETLVNKEN